MDGDVFPRTLQGGEQEEPFGLQGVLGGELQTSNGESEITSCKQVLGVQQTGETKDEVRKGVAEELLGECYQRC